MEWRAARQRGQIPYAARVRLHSISQVDDFTATTSAGGQFPFVDLPGGGYELSVVERRELGVLEFRAEFFNIFNIVNFGLPSNIVRGSGFGIISKTAGSSRQIQFSVKLIY